MVDLKAFFFNFAAAEVRRRIEVNSAAQRNFSYEELGAVIFLIDWENTGESAFRASRDFVTRAKEMGLPLAFSKVLVVNGLGLKDFRYDHFTRRDFNWKGMPKSSDLNELLDKPYDILVDYSDGGNRYLQRILKLAKADVKVGYAVGEIVRTGCDFVVRLQGVDYGQYNRSIFDCLKHIRLSTTAS